jgi:hypothetical protein
MSSPHSIPEKNKIKIKQNVHRERAQAAVIRKTEDMER